MRERPMKTAQSPAPLPISVKQGNSHGFAVAPGAMLVCTTGTLRLSKPPAVVYENMQWVHITLHAGQAHLVEQAGWLHGAAVSDAKVLYVPPPPSFLARLLASGASALGKAWAIPAATTSTQPPTAPSSSPRPPRNAWPGFH